MDTSLKIHSFPLFRVALPFYFFKYVIKQPELQQPIVWGNLVLMQTTLIIEDTPHFSHNFPFRFSSLDTIIFRLHIADIMLFVLTFVGIRGIALETHMHKDTHT